MLHPGLGDDAANYETELTPYCRAFDCRAYVRAGLHLRDPLGDEAVTAAGKAGLCG